MKASAHMDPPETAPPEAASPETAGDAFTARLVEVLRSPEFRTAMIQRLVAASVDAVEGCRIAENAVDRVWAEAGGSTADLAGRVVRAIETGCGQYAEIRGLPYQKAVGPIIRNWPALMDLARQAGLTEEEGYAVLRDLLRKIPRSRWAGVSARKVERELMTEMRRGFAVLGFANGAGQSFRRKPIHANRRR